MAAASGPSRRFKSTLESRVGPRPPAGGGVPGASVLSRCPLGRRGWPGHSPTPVSPCSLRGGAGPRPQRDALVRAAQASGRPAPSHPRPPPPTRGAHSPCSPPPGPRAFSSAVQGAGSQAARGALGQPLPRAGLRAGLWNPRRGGPVTPHWLRAGAASLFPKQQPPRVPPPTQRPPATQNRSLGSEGLGASVAPAKPPPPRLDPASHVPAWGWAAVLLAAPRGLGLTPLGSWRHLAPHSTVWAGGEQAPGLGRPRRSLEDTDTEPLVPAHEGHFY